MADISRWPATAGGQRAWSRGKWLEALFAPAGTPETIVNKLNATLEEIVSDPAVIKAWADTGVTPYPKDKRSPAAARTMLKSEIRRWTQVIRDNNIQGPQ